MHATIVIDCSHPERLADFYAELLGDNSRRPAFQRVAPVYADPAVHPICLCGEGQ